MTTWDVAVVVSHLQLNQALLKIGLWRLVGNCSFSQFTDGNEPFFPEHWVATCNLPFPVDLRCHIINTKTTTARHFEQREGGSSFSFVLLVCNVGVTGCVGATRSLAAFFCDQLSWMFFFPGWAKGLWSTCMCMCTCVVQFNSDQGVYMLEQIDSLLHYHGVRYRN